MSAGGEARSLAQPFAVALHIGCASLRGSIARYAQRFDMLELRAELGALPRPPRLREWARQVGDDLIFSVRLPVAVAGFEPDAERSLSYALKAVDALGARFIVLTTPPAITPTSRNCDRLNELCRRMAGGPTIAWEPGGVWETTRAAEVAAQMGAVLVRDLSVDEPPPGPLIYTRLSRLGGGGRVRLAVAERVGHAIGSCDDVFVVIEGQGAGKAADIIRAEAGA